MINFEHPQKQNSFYRFDPFAKIIVNQFKTSPLKFGLLSIGISIISIGICLSVAWLTDRLEHIFNNKFLIQQLIPLIVAIFLVNPIILRYYLWSFTAIKNVILELELSGVLETNESDFQLTFKKHYSKKWRIFLAIIIAIAASIYAFHQLSWEKKTYGSVLLPPLFIAISTLIVIYFGSTLVLNLIANVQILHDLLKEKKLNVKPLHPDRCGGLRSLSDYSLRTAYLIPVLGTWICVLQYQTFTDGWFPYINLILFPPYILISLIVFFGPLLTAHHGMRKAKEDLLHQIAQWFDREYPNTYDLLTKEIDKNLKKGIEKLQNLRVFYNMTDEFPVWPFDTSTIKRYLLTTSTAFLPSIFNFLNKLMTFIIVQNSHHV